MVVGIALIVVSVLVVGIWVFIEMRRLKHKLFAIALIALILFTYISFSITIKNEDIDFKTLPGITKASKLYFSWLLSVFGNMKGLTTHAIKMDWSGNDSKIE